MPDAKSERIPAQLNRSLAEWGKTQGISYKTAWRMFKNGLLPDNLQAERLPTGTIRIREIVIPIPPVPAQDLEAVIYARINPRQNPKELEDQIVLCRSFCAARGWTILRTQREIAPAVGVRRQKLYRLLNPPPRRLVISKPSILSRFDFRLLDICLRNCRCDLIVVDESDEGNGEGGAMADLVDAVSVICHRHYGVKRGNLMLEEFRKVIEAREA
jgi:putative resolvase